MDYITKYNYISIYGIMPRCHDHNVAFIADAAVRDLHCLFVGDSMLVGRLVARSRRCDSVCY